MSRLHSTLTLLLVGASVAACQTSSATAGRDSLTANIGIYAPAPDNVTRPRVGIPAFSVSGSNAKAEMNDVAADQISTLLVRSKRFNVIERSQMNRLLEEQQLGDVIRDGELTQAGAIRGVDYLLLGKVSNLRTKVTEQSTGGYLPGGLGKVFSGAGLSKSGVDIETECGVDLRLVNPESGEVAAAIFSEFNRKDSADSLGISFRGYGANSSADMQVPEDDYGKIMRLALDDAVRKMLPDIDDLLVRKYTRTEE